MARLTESVDAGKAAAAAAGDMCDLLTQGPICVEGGKKVLTADAAPKSTLAHFTFDDSHGLDTSGLHNHATRAPSFGPGVGGHGHAARFAGTEYTEIRHDAAFSEVRPRRPNRRPRLTLPADCWTKPEASADTTCWLLALLLLAALAPYGCSPS